MPYDFTNNPPTLYPTGTGQFLAIGVGAAAGNVTVVGGVKATDRIKQVVAWKMTPGSFAALDLTSEFTIASANTINNGGGTSTANHIVCALVARVPT